MHDYSIEALCKTFKEHADQADEDGMDFNIARALQTICEAVVELQSNKEVKKEE